MKTIKIILITISIIVVAFLLTGLFVKETTYQTEIIVNKPVNEVFKNFSNTNNIKNWIPEVKTITVVNDNPGKIGSIYKLVVESNGQEKTSMQKVMAYVPNQKVTYLFDSESILRTEDYIFTDKEGKTSIISNSAIRANSYIMACMIPFYNGTFKEQAQGHLDSFKVFAEK